MDKAEEIRDDMRHRVAEQSVRNAQATVEKAAGALHEVLMAFRFQQLTQESVAPAVAEMQALVKLIADAAPSLPADKVSERELAA